MSCQRLREPCLGLELTRVEAKGFPELLDAGLGHTDVEEVVAVLGVGEPVLGIETQRVLEVPNGQGDLIRRLRNLTDEVKRARVIREPREHVLAISGRLRVLALPEERPYPLARVPRADLREIGPEAGLELRREVIVIAGHRHAGLAGS